MHLEKQEQIILYPKGKYKLTKHLKVNPEDYPFLALRYDFLWPTILTILLLAQKLST